MRNTKREIKEAIAGIAHYRFELSPKTSDEPEEQINLVYRIIIRLLIRQHEHQKDKGKKIYFLLV